MKAHFTAPRLALLGLIFLALLSAALRNRPGYILAVGDVFFVEPRPAVVLERDIFLWTDGNAGVVNVNAGRLQIELVVHDEFIADTHSLQLPAGYSGSVALRIGLYDPYILLRLPVSGGDFILLPDALSLPAR